MLRKGWGGGRRFNRPEHSEWKLPGGPLPAGEIEGGPAPAGAGEAGTLARPGKSAAGSCENTSPSRGRHADCFLEDMLGGWGRARRSKRRAAQLGLRGALALLGAVFGTLLYFFRGRELYTSLHLRIKSKPPTMVYETLTPTALPDSLCNPSFTGTSPLVQDVLSGSSLTQLCHHSGLSQMSAPLTALSPYPLIAPYYLHPFCLL